MIKSRMSECMACMGEIKNYYKIVVIKPEMKELSATPRHSWEDNMKMDSKKQNTAWLHVAQGRMEAGSCEHCNEPSYSIRHFSKDSATCCYTSSVIPIRSHKSGMKII